MNQVNFSATNYMSMRGSKEELRNRKSGITKWRRLECHFILTSANLPTYLGLVWWWRRFTKMEVKSTVRRLTRPFMKDTWSLIPIQLLLSATIMDWWVCLRRYSHCWFVKRQQCFYLTFLFKHFKILCNWTFHCCQLIVKLDECMPNQILRPGTVHKSKRHTSNFANVF